MTEQQILDKTIEYLNKYSRCFREWQLIDSRVHAFTTDSLKNRNFSINLLINSEKTMHFDIDAMYYSESVFSSEFHIAYNIIKDLAQHEPNALG